MSDADSLRKRVERQHGSHTSPQHVARDLPNPIVQKALQLPLPLRTHAQAPATASVMSVLMSITPIRTQSSVQDGAAHHHRTQRYPLELVECAADAVVRKREQDARGQDGKWRRRIP